MQETQRFGRQKIPRVEIPGRLVVATQSGNELDPIFALLVGAGLKRAGNTQPARGPTLVDAATYGGFDTLPEWLTDNPDAHLLLLFNSPVTMIARALSDGVEPTEALGQWQQRVEDVLSLVRRNRRRLTLLPLESVLASPATFLELLGERFGMTLETPDVSLSASDAPGVIFQMMAQNAIWQSTEARNLAAELEASALPMSVADEPTLPTVDHVYREFRISIDNAQQSARDLKEENKRLLEQLQQVQQETENIGEEKATLERRLSELEQHKIELEKKAQDSEEVRELQEENDLLLLQLQQVQEELESYFLENRDILSKLENAQKQNEQLEAQAQKARNMSDTMIRDVKNSLSWRMTAPLRAIGSGFLRAGHACKIAIASTGFILSNGPRAAFCLMRDRRIVQSSCAFDADFYLQQCPDVARLGVDPLLHYLRFGASKGLDPNPRFDTDWYLQQNLDVAEAGINPLVHYLRFGTREGRDPNP